MVAAYAAWHLCQRGHTAVTARTHEGRIVQAIKDNRGVWRHARQLFLQIR
jgi:hypothetical protein